MSNFLNHLLSFDLDPALLLSVHVDLQEHGLNEISTKNSYTLEILETIIEILVHIF